MFNGCSKLNYIKALFTTEPGDDTSVWVSSVSETGIFVKSKDANWTDTGDSAMPNGWSPEPDYLCFKCINDDCGCSVSFSKASDISGDLYYKKLNSSEDWKKYNTEEIELSYGELLLMKGTFSNGTAVSVNQYSHFEMTG